MYDVDNNEIMEITEDTLVNGKELAVIFGVTKRRIRQLAEDDIVVSAGYRGRYQLTDSIKGYVAFRAKPETSEEDQKMEKDRRKAELMLKEAKAKVAMLHAKELEGEMHRSEDVQMFTQDFVDYVKTSLLNLPGRCAVELSLCTSAEECSIILKDTVKNVLRELSEYRNALSQRIEKVQTGKQSTDRLVNGMLELLNAFTADLAKEQIEISFWQAEKEVSDLRQRTREGLLTAKLSGRQLGLPKGSSVTTKKEKAAAPLIRKYSRRFEGQLNDQETAKQIGISRQTVAKYIARILAEDQEEAPDGDQ